MLCCFYVLIFFALIRPSLAYAVDENGFERVLVPISVYGVPGAYGSVWSTELWCRNNSDGPVQVFPESISDASVAAHHTHYVSLFRFPAHAPGQILLLSRPLGDLIQFDLRLINESDPNGGWGTKLPVVREHEFAEKVTLINVPTGSGFRTALRIYALQQDRGPDEVLDLRLYDHSENLIAITEVVLSGAPPYAQILSLSDAFPEIRRVDRVRVELESRSGGTPIWAFVSVTSNATQNVAIVTPK